MRRRKENENGGKLTIIVMIVQLTAAGVRLVLAIWPGCNSWPH